MNTYKITYVDPGQVGPTTIKADRAQPDDNGWLAFYIGDKPSHVVQASTVLAIEVEQNTLGDDVFAEWEHVGSVTEIRIDQPCGVPEPGMESFCEYARKYGFGRISHTAEWSCYLDTATGKRRDVYTVEVVPS